MSVMNPSSGVSSDRLPMVTVRERDAVIALCLMAAMADGKADEQERARIHDIVAELTGSEQAADTVFQRVQLYQTSMQAEAAEIVHPDLREQVFEMAVGLVNADGVVSSGEASFLDALAGALQIDPAHASRVVAATDTVAAAPLERSPALVPPPVPVSAGSGAESPEQVRARIRSESDSTVQTYAIIAGALELLPQTLASMAIIPLQMKMVYAIGKQHGYTLDSGHIKDLLATLGVGVTSQVFEGYARRLVGGLLGSAAGTLLGGSGRRWGSGIGRTAAGAAVTFATTYALGKVAQQYYAGGRTLAAIDLQSLFTRELAGARQVYERLAPQVQAQARTLNPASVLKLVRGG